MLTTKLVQVLLLCSITFYGTSRSETVTLLISHVNDINGQLESFLPNSSTFAKFPTSCVTNQNLCVGGLRNIVHWLHDNTFCGNDCPTDSQNTIRLVAGNTISVDSDLLAALSRNERPRKPGSSEWTWNGFGSSIYDFMEPAAVSLGTKELDLGIPQATSFASGFPNQIVVMANLFQSSAIDSAIDLFKNILPYKTITLKTDDLKSNYTIGIIGFISPYTGTSLPKGLNVSDAAETLRDITSKIDDIKAFIAIGDADFETAKQILERAPKIKLVVLSSGNFHKSDILVKYLLPHKQGFITRAGRYGSSVGKLLITLNTKTNNVSVVHSQLQPTYYPKQYNDKSDLMQKSITGWRSAIHNSKLKIAGHARVNLRGGDICHQSECTLGNVLTDAAVYCAQTQLSDKFKEPVHSIWPSRSFYDYEVQAGNPISQFDVRKWLPHRDSIHFVAILGKNLWKVFNISASAVDSENKELFLQVSGGIRAEYTLTSGVFNVTRIRLTSRHAGSFSLSEIDNDKYYYLAIPTYFYLGRDQFASVRQYWTDVLLTGSPIYTNITTLSDNDDGCMEKYVGLLGHVTTPIEGRIVVHRIQYINLMSCSTQILMSILFSMIVAISVPLLMYVGYTEMVKRGKWHRELDEIHLVPVREKSN